MRLTSIRLFAVADARHNEVILIFQSMMSCSDVLYMFRCMFLIKCYKFDPIKQHVICWQSSLPHFISFDVRRAVVVVKGTYRVWFSGAGGTVT